MNLAKAMRKYSNTLLMVFMSLLLIVFLLPSQMFSGGGRGGSNDMQIGRAFGEPVYASDVREAQQVAQLVRMTGLGQIPQFLEPLDVCLLLREAERSGVVCGPEYVKEAFGAMRVPGEAIVQLQDRFRLSREALYGRIGRWLAVEYLRGQLLQTVGASEPRIEHDYRIRNQEANVLVSAISATSLLHNIPEPTEEQLEAFFEEARDRDTAHTEEALAFGYRQPPKVRVEWLTVDPRAIQDEMRVRSSEARSYYEQHSARYVEAAPKTDLTEGPQLESEMEERQLTFEEAEARVKNDLRELKAREESQRLVNDIQTEALQPWLGSTRDEDGFRISPPTEQQASFEALREKFSHMHPVEHEQTDWVSQAELSRMMVGRARHRVSDQQTLTGAELAFRVRGLHEPIENDQATVLNVMEPSPVLIVRAFDPQTRQQTGQPIQAFVLRVLETKPAGPPDSLEAVREQLVADWKATQAYQLAKEQAQILYDQAREVGLPQATQQADALRQMLTVGADPAAEKQDPQTMDPRTRRAMQMLGPKKASTFTRMRQETEVGGVPELAEKAFAVADPLEAPVAERVFLQAVPQRQAWVVAQLETVEPLYREDFEAKREQLVSDAQRRDQYAVNMLWLAPKNVRTRTGWQPAQPTE